MGHLVDSRRILEREKGVKVVADDTLLVAALMSEGTPMQEGKGAKEGRGKEEILTGVHK